MTADATVFPGPADPGPPAVGAFVAGPVTGARTVVRAADLYASYHELRDDPEPGEAYLTLFDYPPREYCPYFVRAGHSPRGYAGPASCRRLVFDIDRDGDLGSALADARTLLRFLLQLYPAKLEDSVAAYFSGAKGFHLTVELLPGFDPTPSVPATCKRLASALAFEAGVRIDSSCYDHQRLFRLPNTRHPRTGLFKRFLTHAELLTLDVPRIAELARHPAGFGVPSCGEHVQELEDDYKAAAAAGRSVRPAAPSPASCPAVPKYVRDFIGWQDIEGESRHVTLFRCAAVLAEAGTPDAVIAGLLEETALKTGLPPADVRRQIACGIERGRSKGGSP